MSEQREIENLLIHFVKIIRKLSGRDCPEDITPDTKPTVDLPGFDGMNAAEVSVKVEGRLGVSVPQEVTFFDRTVKSRQALTIRQVAVAIADANE